MEKDDKLFIVGPCALESRSQLRTIVQELKPWGVESIRASLWKPRTRPGWEGVGAQGIFTLLEETLPYGLTPATEVLTLPQVDLLIESLKNYDLNASLIIWIGARNQCHLFQRELAKRIAKAKNPITLMAKNQMWKSKVHWMGIAEHIISGGLDKKNLMLCHRGFVSESKEFRNAPDYEMAIKVKEKAQVKMILDPSHIGGCREKVFTIWEEALKWPFDGYMLEVHHEPHKAYTDAKQQLDLDDFAQLMHTYKNPKHFDLCLKTTL